MTKTLHGLFLKKILLRPKAVAIITPCKQITYSTLDIYSRNLAKSILNFGLQKEELVAVVMEKGWEQIVAVLAILRAGGAYLPIDPSEPKERLRNLLRISKVKIILTKDQHIANLPSKNKNVLCITESFLSQPQNYSNFYTLDHQNEDNLAYVIFTSGSTGIPKGVMITHKAVCNTILDINSRFGANINDKVLAISKLVFDLSVYDIFGTLSAGGTIIIDEFDGIKDMVSLEKLFFDNQVTIWNSVPVLMEMFINFISAKQIRLLQNSLRLVLLSGDWIPVTLPDKIRHYFGNKVMIVSLGGATEASIWSILYIIDKVDPKWKSIPYGMAMYNQNFIILDKDLNPSGKDQTGELFIGGIGLAKGYWGNKKLTTQHFIDHPKYGKIYRTMDTGKYLSDGNIEFLGRVGSQIKIAGHLIETSAIQTSLIKHPLVNQAVVVPTIKHTPPKLIAYITLNEKFNKLVLHYVRSQVKDWQNIYNAIFDNSVPLKRYPLLNTTGWISSYTNKSIPQIQMIEWVNNTITQIMSLYPDSILEIGCGTGMLLLNIAPQVELYDATDFSKTAIKYIKKCIKKTSTKNINLWCLEAIETHKIDKKYRMVILNSVVQYFPNVEYLIEVINQCIDRLLPSGHLYIGDVRSLCHLREFHASILLNKHHNIQSQEDFQRILEHVVNEDNELVIDHNFFYYMKIINPKISHVQVLLKDGAFHNEMNCFRYNVILHINHESVPQSNLVWHEWNINKTNLSYLREKLERGVDYIAIKNIPNQRLFGVSEILRKNIKNKLDIKAAYKEIMLQSNSISIDPYIISQLSREYNYQVISTWSSNPSYFDCIIKRSELNISFDDCYYIKLMNSSLINVNDFANSPLFSKAKKIVAKDIKDYLKHILPSYMIPQHFLIMSKLPITSNGKIDTRSLSQIADLAYNNSPIILPRNITEKKIVAIWQQVLEIRRIGVTQNFNDLGGNSILTIQLLSKINQQFKSNLELTNIEYGNITVRNLAQHLQAVK